MRPVDTTVTFSESTLEPKILEVAVTSEPFAHPRLSLLLSHGHKTEQEDYIPDFASLVGQSVTVEVTDVTLPEDEPAEPVELFRGTVACANLIYAPGELRLEVEAVGGTSALAGVPRTRIFQDASLQDLLEEILADYLGDAIEATDIDVGSLGNKRISFLAQWNETDWDLLLRLCRRFGLFMMARGRDLFIHTPDPWNPLSGLDTPIELHLGGSLSHFRLGLGGDARPVQASTYQYFGDQGLAASSGDSAEETRTWQGPSSPPLPGNPLAQRVSDDSGRPEGRVVESDDHFSQQEFDAVAGRWSQQALTRRVRGSGESDLPGVGLGSILTLTPDETLSFDAFENVQFMVTRAEHRIRDGVYAVRFDCHADGAPPLLDPARSEREPAGRLVSAVVTDAEDPSRVGRVLARLLPFGEEDLTEEIWVRVLADGCGEGHGTLNLPEIGDEIILALDPTSLKAPLALGSVYNGAAKALADHLPETAGMDSGKFAGNNAKYYLSKAGTCVVHDTTDGAARLIVATRSASIILSEESPTSFDIQVGDGACQIKGDEDGALSIKAKNITIEAEESFTLETGTETTIESSGDLTAKSDANIKVEAAANYEMKSAMAKEEASATYEIKGGASLKLQAAMIDIN